MKTKVVLFVLITSCVAAQPVFVQWTLHHPAGFKVVRNWEKLPKKPDPAISGGGPIDDAAGWVSAIKVGNRIICCCDEYAVLRNKSVTTSYCIRTDPHYGLEGAEVCEYNPTALCAYYGHFSGALVGSAFYDIRLFSRPPEAVIRYGKMMPSMLWHEHVDLWGAR